MASTMKPITNSYGSPRASPFRRPESPASPSPLRQSANPPPATPRQSGQTSTTSRFADPTSASPLSGSPQTPRPSNVRAGSTQSSEQATTTSHITSLPLRTGTAAPLNVSQSSALSQLQPAQLRMLREGFEILDRDSDGIVNREDVADMLNQLGLPSNPSSTAPFFPSNLATSSTTMPRATYLNSLATPLAALFPASEVTAAFAAFDDDDSGQIDLAELRDALLHTAPEKGERALTSQEVDLVLQGFTGKRAFSSSGAGGNGGGKWGGMGGGSAASSVRGEVFRYTDFVAGLNGGGASAGESSGKDAADENGREEK